MREEFESRIDRSLSFTERQIFRNLFLRFKKAEQQKLADRKAETQNGKLPKVAENPPTAFDDLPNFGDFQSSFVNVISSGEDEVNTRETSSNSFRDDVIDFEAFSRQLSSARTEQKNRRKRKKKSQSFDNSKFEDSIVLSSSSEEDEMLESKKKRKIQEKE